VGNEVQAIVRKIWDDQVRPATGALGRIYVGRLAELPSAGARLTLFVDRGNGSGPAYLVTQPIRRLVGRRDRGSVLIDTGTSIYRVTLGRPRLGSLTGLGALGHRERRSFRRLRVATAVGVARRGYPRRIAVTADLSAGGLRFKCSERFELGEVIDVVVRLGQGSDLVTRLSGRVVRVESSVAVDGSDAPAHGTAIVFDKPWQ
jgi:hypothetical protein